MFDQAKHRVKIDGDGGTPLLVAHLVDGDIFHGPDSVVRDKNINPAKMLRGLRNQRASGSRVVQAAADCMAVGLTAFFHQSVSLRTA